MEERYEIEFSLDELKKLYTICNVSLHGDEHIKNNPEIYSLARERAARSADLTKNILRRIVSVLDRLEDI